MFYMEPTNVLKKYYQSKKDIDKYNNKGVVKQIDIYANTVVDEYVINRGNPNKNIDSRQIKNDLKQINKAKVDKEYNKIIKDKRTSNELPFQIYIQRLANDQAGKISGAQYDRLMKNLNAVEKTLTAYNFNLEEYKKLRMKHPQTDSRRGLINQCIMDRNVLTSSGLNIQPHVYGYRELSPLTEGLHRRLQNEAGRDLAKYQNEMARRLGVEEPNKWKTWIWTGRGDTTRHESNDGQTVLFDEPFIIENDDTGEIDEMMYPLDPTVTSGNGWICYCEVHYHNENPEDYNVDEETDETDETEVPTDFVKQPPNQQFSENELLDLAGRWLELDRQTYMGSLEDYGFALDEETLQNLENEKKEIEIKFKLSGKDIDDYIDWDRLAQDFYVIKKKQDYGLKEYGEESSYEWFENFLKIMFDEETVDGMFYDTWLTAERQKELSKLVKKDVDLHYYEENYQFQWGKNRETSELTETIYRKIQQIEKDYPKECEEMKSNFFFYDFYLLTPERLEELGCLDYAIEKNEYEETGIKTENYKLWEELLKEEVLILEDTVDLDVRLGHSYEGFIKEDYYVLKFKNRNYDVYICKNEHRLDFIKIYKILKELDVSLLNEQHNSIIITSAQRVKAISDNMYIGGVCFNNSDLIVLGNVNERRLKNVIAHEVAHQLDNNSKKFSKMLRIYGIIAKDEGGFVTDYAKKGFYDFGTAYSEDFAEAVGMYYTDENRLKRNFPRRYEFIDALLHDSDFKDMVKHLKEGEVIDVPTKYGTKFEGETRFKLLLKQSLKNAISLNDDMFLLSFANDYPNFRQQIFKEIAMESRKNFIEYAENQTGMDVGRHLETLENYKEINKMLKDGRLYFYMDAETPNNYLVFTDANIRINLNTQTVSGLPHIFEIINNFIQSDKDLAFFVYGREDREKGYLNFRINHNLESGIHTIYYPFTQTLNIQLDEFNPLKTDEGKGKVQELMVREAAKNIFENEHFILGQLMPTEYRKIKKIENPRNADDYQKIKDMFIDDFVEYQYNKFKGYREENPDLYEFFDGLAHDLRLEVLRNYDDYFKDTNTVSHIEDLIVLNSKKEDSPIVMDEKIRTPQHYQKAFDLANDYAELLDRGMRLRSKNSLKEIRKQQRRVRREFEKLGVEYTIYHYIPIEKAEQLQSQFERFKNAKKNFANVAHDLEMRIDDEGTFHYDTKIKQNIDEWKKKNETEITEETPKIDTRNIDLNNASRYEKIMYLREKADEYAEYNLKSKIDPNGTRREEYRNKAERILDECDDLIKQFAKKDDYFEYSVLGSFISYEQTEHLKDLWESAENKEELKNQKTVGLHSNEYQKIEHDIYKFYPDMANRTDADIHLENPDIPDYSIKRRHDTYVKARELADKWLELDIMSSIEGEKIGKRVHYKEMDELRTEFNKMNLPFRMEVWSNWITKEKLDVMIERYETSGVKSESIENQLTSLLNNTEKREKKIKEEFDKLKNKKERVKEKKETEKDTKQPPKERIFKEREIKHIKKETKFDKATKIANDYAELWIQLNGVQNKRVLESKSASVERMRKLKEEFKELGMEHGILRYVDIGVVYKIIESHSEPFAFVSDLERRNAKKLLKMLEKDKNVEKERNEHFKNEKAQKIEELPLHIQKEYYKYKDNEDILNDVEKEKYEALKKIISNDDVYFEEGRRYDFVDRIGDSYSNAKDENYTVMHINGVDAPIYISPNHSLNVGEIYELITNTSEALVESMPTRVIFNSSPITQYGVEILGHYIPNLDTLVVYPNGKIQIESTMNHELAHRLDYSGTTTISERVWKDIKDIEGGAVTSYASLEGVQEDFAETVKIYYLEPERLKKNFPLRYEIIDAILNDKEYREYIKKEAISEHLVLPTEEGQRIYDEGMFRVHRRRNMIPFKKRIDYDKDILNDMNLDEIKNVDEFKESLIDELKNKDIFLTDKEINETVDSIVSSLISYENAKKLKENLDDDIEVERFERPEKNDTEILMTDPSNIADRIYRIKHILDEMDRYDDGKQWDLEQRKYLENEMKTLIHDFEYMNEIGYIEKPWTEYVTRETVEYIDDGIHIWNYEDLKTLTLELWKDQIEKLDLDKYEQEYITSGYAIDYDNFITVKQLKDWAKNHTYEEGVVKRFVNDEQLTRVRNLGPMSILSVVQTLRYYKYLQEETGYLTDKKKKSWKEWIDLYKNKFGIDVGALADSIPITSQEKKVYDIEAKIYLQNIEREKEYAEKKEKEREKVEYYQKGIHKTPTDLSHETADKFVSLQTSLINDKALNENLLMEFEGVVNEYDMKYEDVASKINDLYLEKPFRELILENKEGDYYMMKDFADEIAPYPDNINKYEKTGMRSYTSNNHSRIDRYYKLGKVPEGLGHREVKNFNKHINFLVDGLDKGRNEYNVVLYKGSDEPWCVPVGQVSDFGKPQSTTVYTKVADSFGDYKTIILAPQHKLKGCSVVGISLHSEEIEIMTSPHNRYQTLYRGETFSVIKIL